MPSYLQRLRDEASRKGLEPQTKKSLKWFKDRLGKLQRANRIGIFNDEALIKKGRPSIGKMFLYQYDAKHKDDLPYWDKFPLSIIVARAPKGFYSLSMHYLPPVPRARLFDELQKLASNDRWDDTTKMVMTYELLKSTQKFKEFKPCFKHHLTKHIKSAPILIPADMWEIVLFLPLQKFQGASTQKVWRESREIIRKG